MRRLKADDTRRRGRLGTALSTLLCCGLLVSPAAQAAQTTTRPTGNDARTFATSAGGWTTATTYGGVCVTGVTCPSGTGTFVASGGTGGLNDGFLRDTFATTVLSALSSTTVTRTSPAFTVPAGADLGRLNVAVRADLAQLLALNGGPPRLDMVLRDNTTPASSQTLAQGVRLTNSATFTPIGADVATGALDPAHSYSIVLRTTAPQPLLAAASTATVDFDDVALQLVDLEPPTDLTATASTSGPLAISGTVNPHGLSTSVQVNYGVQGSPLSTSTAPVVVSGTGLKPYSSFITGLQPGTTYDFQVVATNADGTATTTTSSFTAATPPVNGPPTVTGAGNSRQRTVTYDVGSGTTGASVQILNGAGDILDTIVDPQTDGQLTVLLPDADGTYTVRVLRESAGGASATSAGVPVVLDRAAPSLAAANLTVTPATSSDVSRSATFVLPGDAVSAELQVLDADGDPVGNPVTATGGMGTVALSDGDGTYTVRLTVRDAAGNAATIDSAQLTLDSSAPSAGAAPTVTGPGNSRTRQVSFTRDAGTTTAVIEVVGPNQQVLGTFPVPAGDNTAPITLPADDGVYGVRVRQTDSAANESVTPSTAVTLDRVAPNPGAAPTVTGADSARARTVTFERDPSTSVAQIEVLDGDGNRVGTLTTVSGSNQSITLPDADGDYRVRVLQTDAAGNTATSPGRTVALDRVGPDAGGAPTVTGATNARVRTVTFVRDPSTTDAQIEVLDAGGNRVGTLQPVTGTSGQVTLPAADGTYSIRVLQSDASGNTATSPGRDVALDQTAPNAGGAPVITGTPDALTVTFVRDPDAVTATVQILDASGTIVREVLVPGNMTSTTLPAMSGDYTVRVVQADAAGNSATSATAKAVRSSGDDITSGTGDPSGGNPGGNGAPGGNGTGGNNGTGTGTDGNGTTNGTGGNNGTDGKGPGSLTDPGKLASILSCLGGPVVITDAYKVGTKARVTGLTLYAPRTVITIRNGAGKKVGTARAGTTGRFATTVKLPRVITGLRYRAVVAKNKSPRLRLQSRNRATAAQVKGKRLTLKGRVAKDVAARLKAGRKFTVKVYGGRGTKACTRRGRVLRTIGKPKVNRSSGRYQITVRAPAGTGKLLVRSRLVSPKRAFSGFLIK